MLGAANGTAIILDEQLVNPVPEFPVIFTSSNQSLLLLAESGHAITSAHFLECDVQVITDPSEFN